MRCRLPRAPLCSIDRRRLDTPVAQGGTNFSGGQRQRLAIARALMKRADLYIFDDSFSALDFKTDAALRHALQDETRDAAVLIIAQRISTILHADQIVVLKDGEVVGLGTHEELMETCEVYPRHRGIADEGRWSSMTEELKKRSDAIDMPPLRTLPRKRSSRLSRRPSWMTLPRPWPSVRLAAKRCTRKTSAPRTSVPAPRQSACATWTTKTRTRNPRYLGDGAPPVERGCRRPLALLYRVREHCVLCHL